MHLLSRFIGHFHHDDVIVIATKVKIVFRNVKVLVSFDVFVVDISVFSF